MAIDRLDKYYEEYNDVINELNNASSFMDELDDCNEFARLQCFYSNLYLYIPSWSKSHYYIDEYGDFVYYTQSYEV